MSDQIKQYQRDMAYNAKMMVKIGGIHPKAHEPEYREALLEQAHNAFLEFTLCMDAFDSDKIINQLARHYIGILNEIIKDTQSKEPRP